MRVQSFFVPITIPPFPFASPLSAAREPARSLKIVHSLGGGQRPRAACAISLGVEPLGARQGRRERRLRPLLRPFDRAGCGLAIELTRRRVISMVTRRNPPHVIHQSATIPRRAR